MWQCFPLFVQIYKEACCILGGLARKLNLLFKVIVIVKKGSLDDVFDLSESTYVYEPLHEDECF